MNEIAVRVLCIRADIKSVDRRSSAVVRDFHVLSRRASVIEVLV